MSDSAIIKAIVRVLAPALRDELSGSDAYYNQLTAPVGRREYMLAARAGAFPARRVGKKILAKKADVHAWIEQHPRPGRAKVRSAADVEVDEELEALGLERRKR